MDYLRYRHKALLTMAYNILFIEVEVPVTTEITLTALVRNGISTVCIVGGVGTLSMITDVLASLPTIIDVTASGNVTMLAELLTSLGIVVDVVMSIDVVLDTALVSAVQTGISEELITTVTAQGRVAQALSTTVELPISFTATMVMPLVGTELETMASIVLYIDAALDIHKGTALPTSMVDTATFDIDLELAVGTAIYTYIDAASLTITSGSFTTALALSTNIDVDVTVSMDMLVTIARQALLSDYEGTALSTMSSRSLDSLKIIY